MESLSEFLEPYSTVIAAYTGMASVAQVLAPALVLNRIRKNPEKNQVPIFPFLFTTMVILLQLRYFQITSNQALYDQYVQGFMISAIYLAFYYFITPTHAENLMYIASAGALVSAIYYYSFEGDQSTMESIYQTIMTSVMWTIHVFALSGIYMGFAFESSEHLGTEMVFGSVLMGVSYLFDGILRKSGFAVFQSLFFLMVYMLQAYCLIRFRSTAPAENEEKRTKSQKKSKKNL